MTQYTEFIKSWAQKHNKSYMCAATDPRAREEYYGSYPKRPTKSKLKQNREKQTAAVMGLMEMGAKAKESAAAKDEAMSMGGEDVNRAVIKIKRGRAKGSKNKPKAAAAEPAAIPERNSDLARYNESKTNPAAGVLTNPDLVRMIGSFIPKYNQNTVIMKKWFDKLFGDKRLLNVDGDLFFDLGQDEVFVSKDKISGRGAISAKEIIKFISEQKKRFTQEDAFNQLGSSYRYFLIALITQKQMRVMNRDTDKYIFISTPKLVLPTQQELNYKLYKEINDFFRSLNPFVKGIVAGEQTRKFKTDNGDNGLTGGYLTVSGYMFSEAAGKILKLLADKSFDIDDLRRAVGFGLADIINDLFTKQRIYRLNEDTGKFERMASPTPLAPSNYKITKN